MVFFLSLTQTVPFAPIVLFLREFFILCLLKIHTSRIAVRILSFYYPPHKFRGNNLFLYPLIIPHLNSHNNGWSMVFVDSLIQSFPPPMVYISVRFYNIPRVKIRTSLYHILDFCYPPRICPWCWLFFTPFCPLFSTPIPIESVITLFIHP